jgi:hypothetical protein
MYLCYIDESGTSNIPGNTSHFVLAGLSIPIWKWTDCERKIQSIKKKYQLENAEIHTGWILRNYTEQNKIPDFERLPPQMRGYEVDTLRKKDLLRLQKGRNPKAYKQTKKNYQQTAAYIHLTFQQRKDFIKEIAQEIGSWRFSRLFAECIDKIFFNPKRSALSTDEQSFEQLVSRFEKYLRCAPKSPPDRKNYGLLVHDNNDTIAKKHTQMMKQFHKYGTLWTTIDNIIETPMFVNSELTSMIQLSDVCAYSIRRYLENDEDELFDEIFKRADTRGKTVVGVRHFSRQDCKCKICKAHNHDTFTK